MNPLIDGLRSQMRKRLQLHAFGGQVLSYGAGSLAQKLLGALLIPLYIHALDPVSLGVLALVELVSNLAGIVVGLGLPYAYIRMASSEKDRLPDLLRTGVETTLLAGFVFSTLLWASIPVLQWLIRLGPETTVMFRIVLVTLPLQLLQRITENLWRIEGRARRHSFMTSLSVVTTLLITAWLLLVYDMGVVGILWARLAGSALVVGAGVYDFLPVFLKGRHDPALRRKLLAFSLPVVPHRLNMVLNNSVDRLLLQYMLGPASVGIYDMGARIAVLIQRMIAPLEMAFAPWIYRRYDEHRNPDDPAIRRLSNGMLAAIAVGTLGLGLAGPRLLGFIDKNGSFPVPGGLIEVLTLGFAIALCYNIVSIPIIMRQQTRIMPIISGAAAGLNILWNLWWIPALGVMGAAWATLASNLVMFGAGWYFGRRQLKITYTKGLMAMAAVSVLLLWITWLH